MWVRKHLAIVAIILLMRNWLKPLSTILSSAPRRTHCGRFACSESQSQPRRAIQNEQDHFHKYITSRFGVSIAAGLPPRATAGRRVSRSVETYALSQGIICKSQTSNWAMPWHALSTMISLATVTHKLSTSELLWAIACDRN